MACQDKVYWYENDKLEERIAATVYEAELGEALRSWTEGGFDALKSDSLNRSSRYQPTGATWPLLCEKHEFGNLRRAGKWLRSTFILLPSALFSHPMARIWP